VDDKVTAELKEIQFHQQTVSSDEHSPLHLIREKEMEISGRVLSAKREADEIVSEARKDATRMIAAAHEEAAQESEGLEEKVKAELEQKSVQLHQQAEKDAKALEESIGARRPEAVKYVIDLIVSA
jgi:vacuolar-type H+-ATPase subunit H